MNIFYVGGFFIGVNLVIFNVFDNDVIVGLLLFLFVYKVCFFVLKLMFYVDLLFVWLNIEKEDNLSWYNFIVMLGFVVY